MHGLIPLHLIETGCTRFQQYFLSDKDSLRGLLYVGSKGHFLIKDNSGIMVVSENRAMPF